MVHLLLGSPRLGMFVLNSRDCCLSDTQNNHSSTQCQSSGCAYEVDHACNETLHKKKKAGVELR